MHLRLLSSFFAIAVLSLASVSGSGLWPVSSDIPSLFSGNSFDQFSAPFLLSKSYGGTYNLNGFGGSTPNPAMMMFLGDPISASFDANQAMTLIADSQNSPQDGEPCQTKLNQAMAVAEYGFQQITDMNNQMFAKIRQILGGLSGFPVNPYLQQIQVSLVSILYSPLYYFCTGNMPGSTSYAPDVSHPTLSSVIWSMDGYLFWNPMIGWNNEQFNQQHTNPIDQPDPSAPKNIFSFLNLPGSGTVDSTSFSQFINPFFNFGTSHFNWNIIFGRPNTPDSSMPDVSAELPQVVVPSNLAIYFLNGQIPNEFTLFCQHLVQIVRTVNLTPDTMKVPPAVLNFFPHANVPGEILLYLYTLVNNETSTPYLPMNPKLALYFPGGTIPTEFIAIIMKIMQCSDGPIDYSTVSCEITKFFEEENIPKEVNNLMQNLIFVYCGSEPLTEDDIIDGDYPPYEEVTDLTLPEEVDEAIPDEQKKKKFIIFIIRLIPKLESPGKIPIDTQMETELNEVFEGDIPKVVIHYVCHLVITWGKPIPEQLYPIEMNPEDIEIPEELRIYFIKPEDVTRFLQILIRFTKRLDEHKVNRFTIALPDEINIIWPSKIPPAVKKFLKIFILYWHRGVPEKTNNLPEIPDETGGGITVEGTITITTPEGNFEIPTDVMTELTENVDQEETTRIIFFMITIVKKMKDPKSKITPDVAIDMLEKEFPDCIFIFEKLKTTIKKTLITWKKKIPTPTEETDLLPENIDETTEQPEEVDETGEETTEENTMTITTQEGSFEIPTDVMTELTENVDQEETTRIIFFMITIVKKMKDPKSKITPDVAIDMLEKEFPDCIFIFEKLKTTIKKTLITWKKKIPTPTEETDLLPENIDETTEQPEEVDETGEETTEENTMTITTQEGSFEIPTDVMTELTENVDQEETTRIIFFMITIVKKMKDPKSKITPDVAIDMLEKEFPDCIFIFEKLKTTIKKTLITWKKKIPTPTEETDLLPENIDETTEQPEEVDETGEETTEENTMTITTQEGSFEIPTDVMTELTENVDQEETTRIIFFMITIVKKMKDPKSKITPDVAIDMLEKEFPDCIFIFEKLKTTIKKTLITWKKKIPTPTEETDLLPENIDETTEQPEEVDETGEETTEENTMTITTQEGSFEIPTDVMTELTENVDQEETTRIIFFMITIVKKMKDPKSKITPDVAIDMLEKEFPDCIFIFEKLKTTIKKTLITWKKKIPTPTEETDLLPENIDETTEQPEEVDETGEETTEENTMTITTQEGSFEIPTDVMTELTENVDQEETTRIIFFMITIVKKMKDPKSKITPDVAIDMLEKQFPDCIFIFQKLKTTIKKTLITWKKKIPTPTEETDLLPENIDETTEQPEEVDETGEETTEENTMTITTQEGSFEIPTDVMTELTENVDQEETTRIIFFMITIVKKMKDPKSKITPDVAIDMLEKEFPDCIFIFEKLKTTIKKTLITWKKKIPTPTEETDLLPENIDETTEQPEEVDETGEETTEENTMTITTQEGSFEIPTDVMTELTENVDQEETTRIIFFMITIVKKMKDPKSKITPDVAIDMLEKEFPDCIFIFEKLKTTIKKTLITWKKKIPTPTEETDLLPENIDETTEQPEEVDETGEETTEENTMTITTQEGSFEIPTDVMTELTENVDQEETTRIIFFMITIVKKMKDPKSKITPDVAIDMLEKEFPDCIFIFEKLKTTIKKTLITWKKKSPTPTEETDLLPENIDETTEQPEEVDETGEETTEENTMTITTQEGSFEIPTDVMTELTENVDQEETTRIIFFMITIVKKMKDPKSKITPDVAIDMLEKEFPDCIFIFEKLKTTIKKTLITWKKKIPTPTEETDLLPENIDETTEQPEEVDETGEETTEENTMTITTQEGSFEIPTDVMTELTENIDQEETTRIIFFMITIVKKMKDPKSKITPDVAIDMLEKEFPDCIFIFEKLKTTIKKTLITWKKKIPTPTEETDLLPENIDETTEQPEEIDETGEETTEENTMTITTQEGSFEMPTDVMTELTENVDQEETTRIIFFMITIVKKMKDPKSKITPDVAIDMLEKEFPDCIFIFEKLKTTIKKTLITWKKKIPTPTEETDLLPENIDETTEQPEEIDETGEETTEENTMTITTQEGNFEIPTDVMTELTENVDQEETTRIIFFMITIVKKMKDPKSKITPDVAIDMLEKQFPDCIFIFEKLKTTIKKTLITWKKKIPTPTEETDLLPENIDETTEQPEEVDETGEETTEENTMTITTQEGNFEIPTDVMTELTENVDQEETTRIIFFMITIVKKMKDPKSKITPDVAIDMLEKQFPDCIFIFEKLKTTIKKTLITWKKKIPTPTEETDLLPENIDETTEQPEEVDETGEETTEENTMTITTQEGNFEIPTDVMTELTENIDQEETTRIIFFMITIVKKMKDPKSKITPDVAIDMLEKEFPDCIFIFEKLKTTIKKTLITWKKKIPTPTEETDLLPENIDETTEQPEEIDETGEETTEENTMTITTQEGNFEIPTDVMTELTENVDQEETTRIIFFMITIVKKMKDPKSKITPDVAIDMLEKEFPDCIFIFEKLKTTIKKTLITWKKKIPTPTEETDLLPENIDETTEQPEEVDETGEETTEENTMTITTQEGNFEIPTDVMTELTENIDQEETTRIIFFMITIVKKMKDPKSKITPDVAIDMLEKQFPDCKFIFEKLKTTIKKTLITWKKKIPTPTEETDLLPENIDETTEQPEEVDETGEETTEENTMTITTQEGNFEIPTDVMTELTENIDQEETTRIIFFMITIVKKMKDPKSKITPDVAIDMLEKEFPDCIFIFEKLKTTIKKTLITWKKKIPTPIEETDLLPENIDETTEQPEEVDETGEETTEENTMTITTQEGNFEIPTDVMTELTENVDQEETTRIIFFMITIVKKMKDPKSKITPDVAIDMLEKEFPDCIFIFEKLKTTIKKTLITWKKKIPTPTEETDLLPEYIDETTEQPEEVDETGEETTEENTVTITTQEGNFEIPTDVMTELTENVDQEETTRIIFFMITIVKKMKDPKSKITPDVAIDMLEKEFPDCIFIFEKLKTTIKKTLITWKKKIPTPIEETDLLPENIDETTEQPEEVDETGEETTEENTVTITTQEGKFEIPTDVMTELTENVDQEETTRIIFFMITIVKKMKDPKSKITPDVAIDMLEKEFPDCIFIFEKLKTTIKKTLITWKKKIPTPTEETDLLPENVDESTELPENPDESTMTITTQEGNFEIPTDVMTELTENVDQEETTRIIFFMITIVKKMKDPKSKITPDVAIDMLEKEFPDCIFIFEKLKTTIKKTLITWKKKIPTPTEETDLLPENVDESTELPENPDESTMTITTKEGNFEIPTDFMTELTKNVDQEETTRIIFFMITIVKKMKDPKSKITPDVAIDMLEKEFPDCIIIFEKFKTIIKKTLITWKKKIPNPTEDTDLLPEEVDPSIIGIGDPWKETPDNEVVTPNLEVPENLRFSFKNNEIPPSFYMFLSDLINKLKISTDDPEIDIPDDVLESMNDEEPSEEVIDYIQEFISFWIEHIVDGPVDYESSIAVPPYLDEFFPERQIPKLFFKFLKDISPGGETTIPLSNEGEPDLESVIRLYFPGGLHPEVIQFIMDCMQDWDRKLSLNLVPIQPVPGAPPAKIPADVLQVIPKSKIQMFQIILQNFSPGGRFAVKFNPKESFSFPKDCMRHLLYIFRGSIPDVVKTFLEQYITIILNKSIPSKVSQSLTIPGDVLKYIPDENSRQVFILILKQMITQYRSTMVYQIPDGMKNIFSPKPIPQRVLWFLEHVVTGVPDKEEELVPGDVTIVYPPGFEKNFENLEMFNSFKLFFISLAPHGSNELKPDADGAYQLPSRILTFFKGKVLPPAVHTFILDCISLWFSDESGESEETDETRRLFSITVPDDVAKEFPGGVVPQEFITYIQELSPNGKNPATISPDGSVGIPPGLEMFFPNGIPQTVINFVIQISIQSFKLWNGQTTTGNVIDIDEIQIPPDLVVYLNGNTKAFLKLIQKIVTAGEKPVTFTPDGQIICPPAVSEFFPDGEVPPPVINFLIQIINSWNEKENPLGFTDPPLGFTNPPLGFTNPPLGFTDPPLGFTNPPLGFTDPPLGFTDPSLGFTDPPLGFTNPPLGFTDPPLGFTNPPLEFTTEPPLEFTTETTSEPTDSPTPIVPSDNVDVGEPIEYPDEYTDITEPPTNVGTGTKPPTNVETGTEPPTNVGTGTEPPTKVGTGTEPPTKVGTGTEPPTKVGTGTEPPTKVGTGKPNDVPETDPPKVEEEYPDEPTKPGTDNGTPVPGQPDSGTKNPNNGGKVPPKVDQSEETPDYPDYSEEESEEEDPNNPTKGQPGNPNTGKGNGGQTPGKNGSGGNVTPDKNGNGGGLTPDKNGNGGGLVPGKNGNGGNLNTDKNGNGGYIDVGKGGGSGSGLNVEKGGTGSQYEVGKGGGSGSQYEVGKGGGSGSQYEIAKGGGSGSQYEVATGGGGGSQYEVMKGGGGSSSYTVGTGGGSATAWTKKVKLSQKQIDKIVTKHNKARSEIAQGLFADGSLTTMEPATNMKALVWDTALVKSAAKQAARCDGKFVKQTNVGENIYVNSTVTDAMKPPNMMADAVDVWKGELVKYPWNNSTDINLIARGLQLAWAKADKIGCAGHQCDSGMVLNVVCHYNNKPDPLTIDTYAKKGKTCTEYSKKTFNKKSGLCE